MGVAGQPAALWQRRRPSAARAGAAGADGKLPRITWNFREGRAPSLVDWPKDQGANDVYSLEGDFSFELKVQDKKDFAGQVRRVEGRKKGGEIEGVEITAPPEGTEPAYTRATGMLKSLGFGEPGTGKTESLA